MVTANNTTITASATTVAEPRSFHTRLDRRDRIGPNRDPGQQHRTSGDNRDHQSPVLAQVQVRAGRSDVASGLRRVPVVAACREAGRFPRGVDAPNLHRQGGETSHAQHQNHDKRGDGECRLDGGGAAITGQTLVLSARLMMLVNAVTIESPVTTV
jgi:hypothetical protein